MSGAVVIDVASREAVYRGFRGQGGDRFLGIRYAEPPLGALRFKPPVRFENRGLVDATRHRFAPPQATRPMPAWASRGEARQAIIHKTGGMTRRDA